MNKIWASIESSFDLRNLNRNKTLVVGTFIAGLLSSFLVSSLFLPDSKNVIITPRCFVDGVSGATRDDIGFSADKSLSPISIQGWFANTGTSLSSKNVVINVVDSQSLIVDTLKGNQVIRDDVATVLNDPQLSNSGFDVEGTKSLQPGTYSLHITGQFGDHLEICRDTLQLTIKE